MDWVAHGVTKSRTRLSDFHFSLSEYVMPNAGLDGSQAGIKIARRNINNLRYADDTTPMTKQRGTKEPLDKGERG